MTLPAGHLIANRYEILRFRGQGQFGEVYEVKDHHQDHVVALKLLDPTKLTAWPWDEATRLTRLRSDHILTVWNADIDAGIPFIVTELATKGTVDDGLGCPPTIPTVEAIRITRHAARGITRTHDDRIVHRDVKLENLFHGDDGRILVGDYGLAHPMDAAGTAPPSGTPATMAPEVFTGGPTSASSDIYSLGACLYRLVTGVYPYLDIAPDVPALMTAVAAGPPSPVRDLAPHVGRGLASRIDRALARNPNDRYGSAAELDADLGRLERATHDWLEHAPHPGHGRCWTTIGAPGLAVCVEPGSTITKVHVTVSHVPSGRRIRRLCRIDFPIRLLPGALRQTFENLSR